MEIIDVLDRKDYNPKWEKHDRRDAARAIIYGPDGQQLFLINSSYKGYYKFPGGGVENGESLISALAREVREEAGFEIEMSDIKEYGCVHEILKSLMYEETILDHYSYYYIVKVKPHRKEPLLESYEDDLGYNLQLLTIDEAIKANEEYILKKKHCCNITRENMILKRLKDE